MLVFDLRYNRKQPLWRRNRDWMTKPDHNSTICDAALTPPRLLLERGLALAQPEGSLVLFRYLGLRSSGCSWTTSFEYWQLVSDEMPPLITSARIPAFGFSAVSDGMVVGLA